MDAYMHIKGHTLIERLRTVRAFVFLFIAMDFHVTAQVTLVVECLATFRTFGRKFFGSPMHRQMVFVVAQLREALAAVGALVAR